MDRIRRIWPIFYVLWTLVTLFSAWFVLADTLGTTAWGGVNLALSLYLFVSVAGFLGLFVGFCSAFSQKRLLAWITFISAIGVGTLSVLYSLGFLFGRTSGVPLSDPLYRGSFHAPIIVLDGTATFCCLVEALLYLPKTKKPQSM